MKYGVGIDVSKGKSMITVMTTEYEVVEVPFEVEHTIKGMEKLEEKIKDIPKERLKIVMEETGTYHMPVYYYLKDKGYCVIKENALKINKYLDREIRKAKTDKKDSVKLAEYCIENWYKLKESYEEREIYDELRFLSRNYFNQTELVAQQKINLSNLCDLVFPGYYQLLSKSNIKIGIKILREYIHPENIRNKKKDSFINEVQNLISAGHKKASASLSAKIYDLSQNTLTVRTYNKNTQLAITNCIDVLLVLIEASENIIAEMGKIASGVEEYEKIKEMDGVGEILAPLLIAEIGDIRKFKNAGSLIAYAGIDAPPYQSGKYDAKTNHISKRGNKYIRKTGYQVMQSLKRNRKVENEIYQFMLKKENEGKLKKVAKIAGVNKFLRQYYGTVKKLYCELNI